jgi:hypothetical protein
MGNKDKRVDEYISKSTDFAKPILVHLRDLVHDACPAIGETIKWGFPHFDYKGMLCSMSSFKQHCAFGFWKTALMKDAKEMIGKNEYAMGYLGKIMSGHHVYIHEDISLFRIIHLKITFDPFH